MKEKGNILIVDDNISLSRTMSFILRRKGYAVATARDGPEAIEKAKEAPFDIIFLDIKMPLMNGVETYREIKKIQPEAVAVMMTAYVVEDLVRDALEEGAYGIIYKPLDIEEVFALMEKLKETKEGMAILVVDDDPGTLITLKNILIKKGYQVSVAQDGDEAIAVARERAHDVILIDMKLPTINGLETYLAIREIDREAVVILVTAYRQEVAELVDEALSHRAYTCLYKPLDMDALLRLVDGIQARKRKAG